VDHAHGRVEVTIDERWRRVRRIPADDKGNRAVGVDVVATVLRVVFEDEDGGVVPVGAVRNGIDDAAERQVVVGD